MAKRTLAVYSEATKREAVKAFSGQGFYEVTVKEINDPRKARTVLQNRAIHAGFSKASLRCNQAGVCGSMVLSIPKAELPATPENIKDVFRAAGAALGYGRETSRMEASQLSEVWDLISVAFLERRGVDIGGFPSIGTQIEESIISELNSNGGK